MLQARPTAVCEEGVATVAYAKELLQLLQALLHGAGARKRSEVPTGKIACSAIEGKSRKLVIQTQANIWKAFIVTQHDIEARLVGLNEVELK